MAYSLQLIAVLVLSSFIRGSKVFAGRAIAESGLPQRYAAVFVLAYGL
jgi:hypothetical protein